VEESDRVVAALLHGDGSPSEERSALTQEKALVRFLFPALSPEGPDRVARDIGRLCYESSLKRLLNYGSPSKELTRSEAKELVKSPQDIPAVLGVAAEHQHLRHAHLQLRSVYDECVSDTASRAFWHALAEHFDFEPCYEEIKSWHQFTDLSHVWARGMATGYIRKELPCADDIKEWIDGGFLHLPACILYFACAALGLNGLQKRGEFDTILSEEKARSLSKRLAMRLMDELHAGKCPAIKSLYAFWVLKFGSGSLDAIRERLSHPKSQRETDRSVCLLYRTWQDKKVPGVNIHDAIDCELLLPEIRRFSRREINFPFILQGAYRFLQDSIEVSAIVRSADARGVATPVDEGV
jgi:hypothetical protein